MRLIFTIKFFALATPLIAFALMPSISLAGPDAGVRCPGGFTATFNNGVLKCSRQVTVNSEFRNSVCPLIFGVGTTYQQIANAADKCTRNDNGATVATVPENAFDPGNYTRVVDGGSGARDRFRKGGQTKTEFAYPEAVQL